MRTQPHQTTETCPQAWGTFYFLGNLVLSEVSQTWNMKAHVLIVSFLEGKWKKKETERLPSGLFIASTFRDGAPPMGRKEPHVLQRPRTLPTAAQK